MTIGLAHAELMAVLVAVTGDEPRVMTIRGGDALPSGPFEMGHRTLQAGLREWIGEQTAHPVGYLEQLYTFADRDRNNDILGGRTLSVSYLGLVRERTAQPGLSAWHGWYSYLPWEDHRQGRPEVADVAVQGLHAWADQDAERQADRRRRIDHAFGLGEFAWNEELVLQRYELLYEAGFAGEAAGCSGPDALGRPMFADHRRILATGIARLRAKIKYRPVVFELMPDAFTLLQLQRAVEALAGLKLHKQNFRRLIEQQDLVEEAGGIAAETGGRPAKLFRFRHAILEERALSGSKLPISRN